MDQSTGQHEAPKNIWTRADFEQMNWHDSHIHAICFGEGGDLLFDIDYIFKWESSATHFNFRVAPCTLVFENVYDVSFDLVYSSGGVDINRVTMELFVDPENPVPAGEASDYYWTIETQEGVIEFKSEGFTQYVRRQPALIGTQFFEPAQRGGISFDKNRS